MVGEFRSKQLTLITALAIAALVAAPVANVQNPIAKNAWIKLPAAGESSARVYADIENRSSYGFYIVSASSDLGGVELRTAVPEDKVVSDIGVEGILSMNPKGFYLRLIDLTRPLKVGETIAISLLTDSNLRIELLAVVRVE